MIRFFLVCFFALGVTAISAQQKRPNIILFLVDDMGWQDTSVPFWTEETPLNKRFHTPSMERLASEGMKFTNAYATPVCTPTRVSLLTGMNVAHHKVTNWTSPYPNRPTDQKDEQFERPEWNYNGLTHLDNTPNAIKTTPFPALLKDEGYLTITVGKAHFGPLGMPGSNPYNFGFMVNIAGHSGGRPQSYNGEKNYGNLTEKPDVHAVPDMQEYYGSETFLTEALTKEALKIITTPIKTKQPFFLLMSHYAVHDPFNADKRFTQKYIDAGLTLTEAKYAALVEGMDKSLGDIMDFLKKNNAEKNTIILFMSDNGGLSHYGRDGQLGVQNAPLRSGKGSVYEGGIREPMIVKWPGITKPGSIAEQYVIIEDFFPTILEMARIKYRKTTQTVDGKSFIPVLKNARYKNDSRTLIWHSPNKWTVDDGDGINYYSAIRKGDWKMVYSMRNGTKELYNLKNDISEKNNLADQNPATVKQLSSELFNNLRKWQAPLPIDKKTGKAVVLQE